MSGQQQRPREAMRRLECGDLLRSKLLGCLALHAGCCDGRRPGIASQKIRTIPRRSRHPLNRTRNPNLFLLTGNAF